MLIIWSTILLVALYQIEGRTLNHVLLNNFERNLFEDYRHRDVDPALTNGGLSATVKRELLQRIHHFANSFDRRRTKRQTPGIHSSVLDSSSFILHGFEGTAGTIPINFPTDLCLFEANTTLYAAALHQLSEHITNQTHLTIFQNYGSLETIDFREIYTYRQKSAEAMDCVSMGNTAFIAIAYQVHLGPNVIVSDGSPVFQVQPRAENGTLVEVVQYFAEQHLNRVYFMKHAATLYFVQSFRTDITKDDPNANTNCLIYIWSGYHFDMLDQLPCPSSMHVEPFHIGSDAFVAVANYRDAIGQVDTFSYIYKYNVEHKKFVVAQRLHSHAAVDLKYFELVDSGRTERFIVLANLYMQQREMAASPETHSIIYKHVNDFFQPFQSILLTDVKQFLPVMGPNYEFLLMIVCANQAAKLWQYNGWNFEESPVQFTGGALGKGVAYMRHYSLTNATAIVVANTNMLKEDNNIYLPIYTVRKNAAAILAADPGWCADAYQEYRSQEPESLLAEIQKQPKTTDQVVTTTNALHFQRVAGKTMTTNSIRTKKEVFDQNWADRVNAASVKLSQLNARLDEYEKKQANVVPPNRHNSTPNDQLGDSRITNIPTQHRPPNQNTNAKHFEELTVDHLHVERINNHPIANLLYDNSPITANTLKVDTLIVTSQSQYDQIMAATKRSRRDLRPEESNATAEKIEYPDQVDEIVADELIVDGTINGIDLATIQRFALRVDRVQTQELTAQFNFGQLQADVVQVDGEIVSRRNISDIVRTAGGPYTIFQDVSFNQPLVVNRFYVYERINHIMINDMKMDVLLKQSPDVQRITGFKRFDSVKLRSPIVLHGKISNTNLEKVNPIVSLTKDIELVGDFVISGNVTIKEMLSCTNLFGASGTYSAQYVMDQGLLASDPEVPVSMEFVQPIRTKELLVRSVNNVDVTQWASTGHIQEITGKKTFTGDLHISKGFCDVVSVNGLNLIRLNETVLKKSGDQTIEGNIQFRKITVRQHSSQTELFAGKQITDFLNHKDQIITGNVTIRGNLLVRNSAQIKNMQSAGRIDGFDIPAMLADTLMMNSPITQVITGETFFKGNVTFGQVNVDGNLFGLGTWTEIQQSLHAAQQDISLNGPRRFTNSMRVGELVVRDTINGIPSDGFGKLWLLKESDQNFTAPQTISGLSSTKIWTQAPMNNIDLRELFESSVRLNESLSIDLATFESIISQAPIVVNGLVNGMKFPDEIIVSKSTEGQVFSGMRIAGDLQVNGRFDIGRMVNGMDCSRLDDLIGTEPSPFGLHVLGSVEFPTEPITKNLNGINVAELASAAWYLDENTVLGGNLSFTEVSIKDNIELTGFLNQKNLSYLNENYVSLSRDQEIVVNLTFNGNVMFKDTLEAGLLQALDTTLIRSSSGAATLNIHEFCKYALRKETNQEITAQWSFNQAIVHDNLNALINGLDLRTDVVRYSVPMANITAPKRFRNLIVEDLFVQNDGRVQDVAIAEWMAWSALVVGNYTIQGTTTLVNPTIFGDVKVFGRVNNVPFTPDSILTKSGDQQIRGNVRINNKRLSDNQIQSLTINNVQLNTVNGIPIDDFFRNIVYDDREDAQTAAHLVFTQPLVVGSFHSKGQWNGVSLHGPVQKLGRHINETNGSSTLGMFHQVGVALNKDIQNRKRHLEAFRYRQSVEGNVRQISTIRYATSRNSMNRVYVMYSEHKSKGSLSVWKWNPNDSQMIIDDDHFALNIIDMEMVDMSVVTLFDKEYLIVETVDGGINKLTYFTFIANQMRIVFESLHNGTQNTVAIPLYGLRSCVGLFTEYVSIELQLECVLFTPGGFIHMEAVGAVPAFAPLVQVVSYSDAQHSELIMLDVNGDIAVWKLSDDRSDPKFEFVQKIVPLHLSRTISTTRYRNSQWLATSSAFVQNSTHLGSVDVYRCINGSYVHVQSIPVDIPAQIEIATVRASGELVLYVLTESRIRPFIVFRYTGVTQFREFFVAATLPMGRRFKLIGPTDDDEPASTELIAVMGSEEKLDIIESVLN